MDEKYRQLQRLAQNDDKESQILLGHEASRAGQTPSLDYLLDQWQETYSLVQNKGLDALKKAFTKLCQDYPRIEKITWSFDELETNTTEWDVDGFCLHLNNLDAISSKDYAYFNVSEFLVILRNFLDKQERPLLFEWLDETNSQELEEMYGVLQDFLKITGKMSDAFVQAICPKDRSDFAFSLSEGLLSK